MKGGRSLADDVLKEQQFDENEKTIPKCYRHINDK
jgi:hypothetical protein